MAKEELTKKWVMKQLTELSDAILTGQEAYATKDDLERVKKEIIEEVTEEVVGKLTKVIQDKNIQENKRIEKTERRVYNLEDKVEQYHPTA